MMRNIDRFLGVPFCWIVGGALKILPKEKEDLSRKRVVNILVIKFFGLGSILLSTPALSMLRSRFPQGHITFLTFSSNRDILERINLIDHVITLDPSNPWTFLLNVTSLLRIIYHRKYEIVLDFEFFSKFATAVCGFSRAQYRVGFELLTKWRRLNLTHSVPFAKGNHVREAFCAQVRVLCDGKDFRDILPPLIYDNDVDSMQRKIHVHGHQVIVVNVNAGDTFLERRWPSYRFVELISTLAKTQDYFFVLTGISTEREYVEEIINRTIEPSRCFNAAGLLTISELGALLQMCQLMISNDSGPLHLAASLGVATIGLFGPESPDFYGPLGPHAISIYKRISCSPCMNVYNAKTFRCPYGAKCMKNIETNDVVDAMNILFQKHDL
jgi:ADP-heptose:LPS heptosyltransferase